MKAPHQPTPNIYLPKSILTPTSISGNSIILLSSNVSPNKTFYMPNIYACGIILDMTPEEAISIGVSPIRATSLYKNPLHMEESHGRLQRTDR